MPILIDIDVLGMLALYKLAGHVNNLPSLTQTVRTWRRLTVRQISSRPPSWATLKSQVVDSQLQSDNLDLFAKKFKNIFNE